MFVNLEQPEWNQLLGILAQAPWNVANPLIMRIGEQLRAASEPASAANPQQWKRPNGPDEEGLGLTNQAGKPQ